MALVSMRPGLTKSSAHLRDVDGHWSDGAGKDAERSTEILMPGRISNLGCAARDKCMNVAGGNWVGQNRSCDSLDAVGSSDAD